MMDAGVCPKPARLPVAVPSKNQQGKTKMHIYNLISVYTRSTVDDRPLIQGLGVFDDIDDAKAALVELKKTYEDDGWVSTRKTYGYSTECRLTKAARNIYDEHAFHASIVTTRINISIGEK